jgi:hypothetical protein
MTGDFMNAIEQSVLRTIHRGAALRSGASRRYRVKVGSIDVVTAAASEADAVKRANQWHARHVASLSKKGLRHAEDSLPEVVIR